jgi:hypothetical protein
VSRIGDYIANELLAEQGAILKLRFLDSYQLQEAVHAMVTLFWIANEHLQKTVPAEKRPLFLSRPLKRPAGVRNPDSNRQSNAFLALPRSAGR